MEELASKAVQVSTDAACSRTLETLLPAADAQHLLAFLEAFLEAEGTAFCDLSARSVAQLRNADACMGHARNRPH